MALGWILFAKGDRHVTAEMLYEEATRAKVPVSLATVYNTLHQFTEVGLLRQVAVDGSKAYFDTNNSEHHHFFIEDRNDLLDIPTSDVIVGKAPVPPEGYEIARIDVVVRLRRKQGCDSHSGYESGNTQLKLGTDTAWRRSFSGPGRNEGVRAFGARACRFLGTPQ